MPQTPSFGFGPIPWWVWNGTMKYAEIERQLVLMKDAGMEGWTLWARFGLEMEYLSHDFMQRFRFAVQKSAELGLDVWVFDEFAWPTCSARVRRPRSPRAQPPRGAGDDGATAERRWR